MRRAAAAVAASFLVGAMQGGVAAGPVATGFSSSNVEHLTTIPIDAAGGIGARIHGRHLYVSGARSLSIYDVSEPSSPQLVSTTPIGFHFANEDVDTNGRILLMADDSGLKRLTVYDVRDKSAPTVLSELMGLNDHNFACVLDCRWAYGSRGNIVDLRDPEDPKLAGRWNPGYPGDGYDTTEVAPGMVLTATRLIQLLDGRRNPAKPKVVALGSPDTPRLIHSVRWPRGGRDRFFTVQGETPFSGPCKETSGAFMTFSARNWRSNGYFRMIDEFRVGNGTFVDGNPPANAAGCTAMWHDPHPDFHDGGIVASAFFEHGVRFLRISGSGRISEAGYFMPFGGETSAVYWANDHIAYTVDLTRGIDVLRFDG